MPSPLQTEIEDAGGDATAFDAAGGTPDASTPDAHVAAHDAATRCAWNERRDESGVCVAGCNTNAQCATNAECNVSTHLCVELPRPCPHRQWRTPDGRCQPGCDEEADCEPGTGCDLALHACYEICAPEHIRDGLICVPGCDTDEDCYSVHECDATTRLCIPRCNAHEMRCEGSCAACPGAISNRCEGAACVVDEPCADWTTSCAGECVPWPVGATAVECIDGRSLDATECATGMNLDHGRCAWTPEAICPAVPIGTRRAGADILSCPCPTGLGPHGEVYACDPTVNACAYAIRNARGELEFHSANDAAPSFVVPTPMEWRGDAYATAGDLSFDFDGRPIGFARGRYWGSVYDEVAAYTTDTRNAVIAELLPQRLWGTDPVRGCANTWVERTDAARFTTATEGWDDFSRVDEPGSCDPYWRYEYSYDYTVDCYGFHATLASYREVNL